jgi:hypothetical protein
MIPAPETQPTHLSKPNFEKNEHPINTSCKLSPVKHFNYMPAKLSFNEVRL